MQEYCYIKEVEKGKYWVHVVVKMGQGKHNRQDIKAPYVTTPRLSEDENYANLMRFCSELRLVARAALNARDGGLGHD